ncbi:hypothetical protein [Neobacillus kokaensis]|uniref:Lipoprotein YgaO n=1 Tax=Neobacillus kokaensis TaxID=2759023 RepID=A0ABQ3N8G1_9BACI|nr:hypothetical protein [Neobacillus kokaensis]GHI00372.1 putative lipoprotein YgaO [Neobacillus kokaensis]
MKIVRNGSIIIVSLILFGWMMSGFYQASLDIVEFSKDTSRGFLFEINIVPFLLLIILSGMFTLFTKRIKKKKILWLPEEFEESDEREQQITARACRAAYISMIYAFPIITVLLLFYPFISKAIPYYPIIVFILLPLTQIMTYMISWQKNYK